MYDEAIEEAICCLTSIRDTVLYLVHCIDCKVLITNNGAKRMPMLNWEGCIGQEK